MRPRLPSFLSTLLFVGLAALALWPIWRDAALFASRYDWRYFESMGEMSRRSVLWYKQVPLWNPYSCGGEVALANPQSLDAAPTFLLVLLFGTALGYKLALGFYYFCAMDGTRRLGRHLGLSEAGAVLAALGYGLSGYLALHLSAGHFTFLGVTLYPYLLLCFDRSIEDIEWAIPTGLWAAWIAVLGGTFTPPMAAELLFVWATFRAITRFRAGTWQRALRPYGMLLLAGAVALGLSAVRMVPVLEFIHDHPRPPFMRAVDASWPWQIFLDLSAWREMGPLSGRKYWSHEYTARLPYGLLPLWLLSVPLLFARRMPEKVEVPEERRRLLRRLWVVTAIMAIMAMGNFSPVAPWSLLQRLPVLRDLRVPSRHLILVTLTLALLAGVSLDAWSRVLGSKGRAVLVAVLIGACAVDGAVFTALRFRGVFSEPIPLPKGPVPFYHAQGTWRNMREVLFSGRGSLGCDEEAPLQRAEALDPGDVPQERLLDPAAGEVVGSWLSPNQRVVTVELRQPTVLLINSNWNEHWKTDRGRVTRVAGRLAVDLSPVPMGRQVITLRYAPRSFYVGAVISAVLVPGLLGLFFFVRLVRGRPRWQRLI